MEDRKCERRCFPGFRCHIWMGPWLIGLLWGSWSSRRSERRRRATRASGGARAADGHPKRPPRLDYRRKSLGSPGSRVSVSRPGESSSRSVFFGGEFEGKRPRLGASAAALYKGFLRRRKCRGCSSREARLCLLETRLASSPHSSAPPRSFTSKKHHILWYKIRYRDVNGGFSRFPPSHRGVLTAVAGTRKHGRSAESPTEARRAAWRSVPLEGFRDRRSWVCGSQRRVRDKQHKHVRLWNKKWWPRMLTCVEKLYSLSDKVGTLQSDVFNFWSCYFCFPKKLRSCPQLVSIIVLWAISSGF